MEINKYKLRTEEERYSPPSMIRNTREEKLEIENLRILLQD